MKTRTIAITLTDTEWSDIITESLLRHVDALEKRIADDESEIIRLQRQLSSEQRTQHARCPSGTEDTGATE